MRSDSEYKVGVKVEYPKTIRGKKCDICHSYTPKGSPYVLVSGVWSCCSEKCKELALKREAYTRAHANAQKEAEQALKASQQVCDKIDGALEKLWEKTDRLEEKGTITYEEKELWDQLEAESEVLSMESDTAHAHHAEIEKDWTLYVEQHSKMLEAVELEIWDFRTNRR